MWIWFRAMNTRRKSGGDSARSTSMIDLENEEEYDEESSLGTSSRHASVTGNSSMVSDAHTTTSQVGDDESEGTCGNVEIR